MKRKTQTYSSPTLMAFEMPKRTVICQSRFSGSSNEDLEENETTIGDVQFGW